MRIVNLALLFLAAFFLTIGNIGSINGLQKEKRAIIVGATSGMGKEVAKLLATSYTVGLAGRRIELLKSLKKEIKTRSYVKQIDVSKKDAIKKLKELIKEMGGLDLMLISISAANDIKNSSFEETKKYMVVDLYGFWIMAETALEFFKNQKSGHLVGWSSTSAIRGDSKNPTYGAAKAFISKYLEGKRNQMIQNNVSIYFTDIIPGWVEVEAVDVHKIPEAYWIATTKDAAKQIVEAIEAKKKRAYITKRWQVMAVLWAIIPDCIYNMGWFKWR